MNCVLCKLWALVYSKWLDEGDKVVAVLGWRTARVIRKYGQTACMTPIFWWLK